MKLWDKKPQGPPGAVVTGKSWYKRLDVGISLVVTAVGVLIFYYAQVLGSSAAAVSFIQNVELRSLDARFVLRGERPHDPRIVIVDLDEKTLEKVGSFPIARNAYARVIENLKKDGASIVAFDIVFPKPEKNSAVEALKKLEAEVHGRAPAAVVDRIREIERTSDNDAILAESMKHAENVILGHIFLDAVRAKSQDPQAAEDYYNILWGQPFPQMRPLPDAGKFDLNTAWSDPRQGHLGKVFVSIEPNIRIIAEAARSYGFFNNEPDGDGTYRRAILLVRYQNFEWYPSLALEAVRQYEEIPNEQIIGWMGPTGLDNVQMGQHVLKTRPDATMLINFAGPFRTYQHYSMVDVMNGALPPQTFRNKIVLLGSTALGIGDIRPTPFQSADYMGVEIHANIIDNILHNGEKGRGFLTHGRREEMIDLAFLLAFGLGLGYLFGHAKPITSTVVAIVALAVFAAVVYETFARFSLWLSFVLPAGVLVANYAAVTSFRMIFEEREKRKIRHAFGQYVAPGVIALLEQDPERYFKPGGERREITVMFSDIRSFTTIAEDMTPEELVSVLNEYLGQMTDVLFKSWGTLDKYIGDALMAFWNSPYPQEEHAMRGASCALNMLDRLAEMNAAWAAAGKKQLSIGIGLNTGPVNVGNMGSEKRLSWTVMGDNVNLASRLEGMTKEYHCPVIVSEFTYEQIRSGFVCRELDRIRVMGKMQPVAIYELMGFLPEREKFADLLEEYEEALAAYRRHEWDKALKLFEALLAKYPHDGPSQVLLQRCIEFCAESPAEDWDGVYDMKTK
ncbi:MAG: adenylate/guanylate cyclase domain-containing protein [Acidobacteriia bacterium]|nr:adenylate/guanylate cyclase domain-containing protein [Terriglobia bacterium]